MTKLEMEFTQELLKALNAAEQVTGVAETRLREQAQKDGGAKAMKRLLGRSQLTRQFALLQEKRRLDLCPEFLVTRGRFGALFTDEEVNLCLEALLEAGVFS